jgi:7,8-dihydroneopterin aldolase/epimerase/oxygenase
MATMLRRPQQVDKVFLRGLKFFGRHGVLTSEAELGQPFTVDVELRTCLKKPGRTDQIEHTVDYSNVFNIVKNVIEGGGGGGSGEGRGDGRYNLIESLASRIATDVLLLQLVDHSDDSDGDSQQSGGGGGGGSNTIDIDSVMVRVTKPHVAFPATLQDVGVEIHRSRDDLPDLFPHPNVPNPDQSDPNSDNR